MRTLFFSRTFPLAIALVLASACTDPTSDVETRENCTTNCTGVTGDPTDPSGNGPGPGTNPGDPNKPPRSDDGVRNGEETDVDCGGPSAPACAEGKKCLADKDCNGACTYAKVCADAPSCKPHLGGDTCGKGEVGMAGIAHESCCRTLPVKGFTDAANPGKQVYLDKYEITVGRVRAFLEDMAAKHGGMPNVRDWIKVNRPRVWDPSWDRFLPADVDQETILVNRLLLGDPRGTWPGAPPVPPTDEPRKTGTDFQFNGNLFVYLHGNNCSTHTNAFGFPTFFYPAESLAKMGPQFAPFPNGTDFAGNTIPSNELFEVKSINCIPNALLQAFCHWDGGQLATGDVMDFVTASPPTLGDKPGCGTQVAEDPPTTDASMKGGRCADLTLINATYDAGASLPEPNHPRNANNYVFPFFPQGTTFIKSWEVAAPGRGTIAAGGEAVDQVRMTPGDEPWMDLAGNVSEAVLKMNGATFTGKFGLKFRGIGYQSARSRLNFDPQWDEGTGTARIERAEAKGGFSGGRCMRFR